MRKETFVNDQYYHIYNRGVDKRDIFLDEDDHFRFLHNMYVFNDIHPILDCSISGIEHMPSDRRFVRFQSVRFRESNTIPEIEQLKKQPEREKLVEIFCYCLMPNHFHFILKQLKDGGITKFMRKLCVGYANYFNKKYERSGALFQGRFKAVLVETDAQMMHLSRYIHVLNPGEMVEPDIREGKVRDEERLGIFLKKYRWSSYLDFLGFRNYPSLITKEFLLGYFKDVKEFERFSTTWKRSDLLQIEPLTIE